MATKKAFKKSQYGDKSLKSIYCETALWDRLEKLADADDRSLTNYVERVLQAHVGAQK